MYIFCISMLGTYAGSRKEILPATRASHLTTRGSGVDQ